MLIISNEFSSQMFSCHQEVIDFIGEEDFNAIISGEHSEYSLSFLPIT